MNDLEEQVRDELATSAHGWTDRIDPDRVLADGRRALRQRALRRVAMVAVSAVVAGALGWAGLVSGLGRSATSAVVATPSPAPSTTTMNRVTFDLTVARRADYASLEVTLTNDGTLWLSGTDATGGVRFTSPIDATYVTAHGATIDVGVPAVVGLIPGNARWIRPVTTGSPTLVSDVQELPAAEGSVYLVLFDSGRASQFRGVCWEGADGEVHQSDGASPDHAGLDFAGHRGTFFFTDLSGTDQLVFHSDSGNSFSFEAKGGHYRPYFSSGSDGAGTRSMMVALLPWNATDPAVDLADQAATWTTIEVGGRRIVVVSGTADTMAGMVRSISYTDEVDGRVTQQVR